MTDNTTTETIEPTTETPEVPSDDGATLITADTVEEFLTDDADDLDAAAEPTQKSEPTTALEGQEPKTEPTPEPEPEKKPEPEPKAEPAPEAEQVKKELEAEKAPLPEQTPEAKPAPEPVAKLEPTAVVETPEEAQKRYQATRVASEASIAKDHYALTEDQARRLDEGDASLIPELMAKTYMDAVSGSVAQILAVLPSLIQSVQVSQTRHSKFEDEFYAANPALNREAHAGEALKFGKLYRQAFPKATDAQFIRDVGAQIMVAHQLVPTTIVAAPAPEPTPVPAPHKPAGAAGLTATAAPTQENAFSALAREADDEALDLD